MTNDPTNPDIDFVDAWFARNAEAALKRQTDPDRFGGWPNRATESVAYALFDDPYLAKCTVEKGEHALRDADGDAKAAVAALAKRLYDEFEEAHQRFAAKFSDPVALEEMEGTIQSLVGVSDDPCHREADFEAIAKEVVDHVLEKDAR